MKYIQEPSAHCPIYYSCSQCKSDMCTEYCWKMVQIRFQLDKSNMPDDYKADIMLGKSKAGKDFEVYQELSGWARNLRKLLWRVSTQGEGLYMHSTKKGNGKTSWACKIMFNYIRAMGQEIESLEKPKVLFVSTPQLFDDLKAAFDNDEKAREMSHFEDCIKDAELVIFDDIGAETPSKWVKEKLYIYINFRESNRKSTIFTSNCTIDELANTLDDRITDRIYGLCRKKYGDGWREDAVYNILEFKDSIGR